MNFPDQSQFVFGDLGVAAFSQLARANYADVVPVIPESEWKGHIERLDATGGGADKFVTRIYDQQQEGSCVANACAQAHEITQAKQVGLENVIHLSAISLYKRIGSSPQSGAMVSDGLEELAAKGILPLDTPENRTRFNGVVMPNTGFRLPYPANWQTVAAQLTAEEWFIVDSMGELVTALIHQDAVVVGRSGHSICYCRPVYDGGNLLVKYANSWGSWGEEGFGYDSLRLIRQSASWAFALRSVKTPAVTP